MIALKNVVSSEFVERVHAFFSANGPLSKAKNFEFRPQQQEMAVAVARALEEDRHLVVEAGTGVGKSLAYLVPAILFALEQHKKAIISTHTINLQEQLLYKDIPILKKVRAQVCSEAHICTQKTCGQNPRCFYQQARKKLLVADVIVLNHTLLFVLLGDPKGQEERESGFLFPNDFIIFDEAHTVEQVASKQIGIGVSQYG